MVSCTISRNGDLAYQAYVEIVLKKGSTPSYFPAEAILSQVELQIGGTRIDLHYADWYRIYSELFRSSEEKLAYRRMTDFVDGESEGALKRLNYMSGKVSSHEHSSSVHGKASCGLDFMPLHRETQMLVASAA